MHEDVLRQFFEGGASAADLAHDLEGALVADGPSVTRHPIVDMVGAFEVQPHHLVRVCEAVLDGAIQPALLEAIGFCLVASDAFHWDSDSSDGGRVADVAYAWSAQRSTILLRILTSGLGAAAYLVKRSALRRRDRSPNKPLEPTGGEAARGSTPIR